MTRRRPSDAERAALFVACRLCGVEPLAWCRTVWTLRPGAYATALHRERLEDGAAGDRLPIDVAAAGGARWVALEQVPGVLPLREAVGEVLAAAGYFVWTGLVYSERYGVPQTRVRAVLLAHRDRPVGEPRATHADMYLQRKGGAR